MDQGCMTKARPLYPDVMKIVKINFHIHLVYLNTWDNMYIIRVISVDFVALLPKRLF